MPEAGPLAARRVAVHVGGSVAAFKAASVVTALRALGAEVRVAMTPGACRFVAPLTLQSLSGAPVLIDLWTGVGEPQGMPHLSLAGWCDLQVVVAASANLIARLAAGLADDAVTATVLACRAPLLVAPAMETAMWESPATAANVATLAGRGAVFVGPVEGRQASGALGSGRMAEAEDIVAAVRAELGGRRWDGAHVVVTAGGTREPIDAVRFIGNRSSGRMGNALAAEACAQGARVTLITAAPPPAPLRGLTVVAVETAAEMRDAVWTALDRADLLLMAAAVADHRPATVAAGKPAKAAVPSRLSLVPTDDILAALRAHPRRARLTIVGFAAETDSLVERAADKLRAKGLDYIVANDVSVEGIGMGAEDNAVTVIAADGSSRVVDRAAKRLVARAILAAVQLRGAPAIP